MHNKTIADLATNFSEMRSEVYIVGVGNNVDYGNLLAIKNSHEFARLYVSASDEGLYRGSDDVYGYEDVSSGAVQYLDVADKILERERIQTREGDLRRSVRTIRCRVDPDR